MEGRRREEEEGKEKKAKYQKIIRNKTQNRPSHLWYRAAVIVLQISVVVEVSLSSFTRRLP
jgi:hypothetical protein